VPFVVYPFRLTIKETKGHEGQQRGYPLPDNLKQ
jgi:hypothetical protein